MREPMLIRMARVRLAWFEIWKEIGILLANKAQDKIMVEANQIREWERESKSH